MADAFIVRRGGGGKAYAMLLVTYPAGSTITCTNTSGKKAISSTEMLFYVKSAGDCVVTITNGVKTVSRTVSFTYEGQSEAISISYTLIIHDASSGTKVNWTIGQNASVTFDASNRMVVKPTSSEYAGLIGTSQQYDLSSYSRLCMEYTSTITANTYNRFGVGNSIVVALPTYVNYTPTSTSKVVELDISSINTGYIVIVTDSRPTQTLTVTKIWVD